MRLLKQKIFDTFYPLLVFVLVITNQNLFESKKSSRIKTIKYHATTDIFFLLSAMTLTSREKISVT